MVTYKVCFSQVLEMNEYNSGDIKFAAFSNSTFMIYHTLKIDSKLDRSVEGLLVTMYYYGFEKCDLPI